MARIHLTKKEDLLRKTTSCATLEESYVNQEKKEWTMIVQKSLKKSNLKFQTRSRQNRK
jgi:hypothetical protein